jgi:hypothetical protein
MQHSGSQTERELVEARAEAPTTNTRARVPRTFFKANLQFIV